MPCSPNFLFMDIFLWFAEDRHAFLSRNFQNLSKGEKYDCALATMPCESNMTKMITYDPSFVFWFDIIVVYVLMAILSVMGVVGNTSNIIIFYKFNIANDSTNNLLLGLSVSDLLFSLTLGTIVVCSYMCFVDERYALNAYNIVVVHCLTLTRWFSLLSLDIVTIISLQRAVAVVFPFKIATIFSNKNTNIIMAILSVLFLSFSLPLFVTRHPKWLNHPAFTKPVSLGYITWMDFTTSVGFMTIGFNVRSAVDLALLIITGSLTILKLRRQSETRSSLKADASIKSESSNTPKAQTSVGEAKVIKLSLTVCFVTFIMFTSAFAINGLLFILVDELHMTTFPTQIDLFVVMTLSVNSCFNFFLYLKMSSKYRSIFKNGFRGTSSL